MFTIFSITLRFKSITYSCILQRCAKTCTMKTPCIIRGIKKKIQTIAILSWIVDLRNVYKILYIQDNKLVFFCFVFVFGYNLERIQIRIQKQGLVQTKHQRKSRTVVVSSQRHYVKRFVKLKRKSLL